MEQRRDETEDGGNARAARAILIAGPTASGKSALAVAVAAACHGVVINADSMQVYADIPILSAQPSPTDRAQVPHALFGHIDAAATYSVGRWLDDVGTALAEARRAARRPVIVGGTGLYFKALTQGLSAMPEVPADLRAGLRAEAAGVAPAALHARLAAIDPVAAARLRPSDPQRILRALEVVAATGRSITTFQAAREPPLLPPDRTIALFLQPAREVLRRQIDERFAAMMAAGALDEAAKLAGRDLNPALPAMRALGVPPLLAHLRQSCDRDTAVAAATRDTRAYARRQITFGRHQLADFTPLAPDEAERAVRIALAAGP